MDNDTVEKVIKELKNYAEKSFHTKKYEKSLTAIEVGANILYRYNQIYKDDEFENLLVEISNRLINKGEIKKKNEKIVVFYDGFGLDTRGLALIFLKAIAELNYKLIYITKKESIDSQPTIKKILSGYNVTYEYISDLNRINKIKELNNVFLKYNPTDAFLYTTPSDVGAITVFNAYKGKITRYQIDLTDHAFWLGINAFDYCISLRDLGATIEYNYRMIPKEKIIFLPYYAYIDKSISFQGFPFDSKGKKVIFSGGSLYKTLGDNENKYYKIVEHILENHADTIFLYAGEGDNSQIELLQKKFNNRVFHISERKDLYQVMLHSTLYLNTYPMFGGLMMHYAVSAHKIPITLKHNHDADGLLFKQDQIKIEYEDVETLEKDVDKLLKDESYLKERENLLLNSEITEEQFKKELNNLILYQKTNYLIKLDYVDTNDFRKEFLNRFKGIDDISKSFGKKDLVLFKKFWRYFLVNLKNKLK